MLKLDHVVGFASEPRIAEALHELEHRNGVEHLVLSAADTQRRHFRALTDRGTECAVALPRTQRLGDGAVLLLEPFRAVVVRMHEPEWLTLVPRDPAAALELGYFAGNMHWKVQMDGDRLRVALQGPAESYLERLEHLLADGRVAVSRSPAR